MNTSSWLVYFVDHEASIIPAACRNSARAAAAASRPGLLVTRIESAQVDPRRRFRDTPVADNSRAMPAHSPISQARVSKR